MHTPLELIGRRVSQSEQPQFAGSHTEHWQENSRQGGQEQQRPRFMRLVVHKRGRWQLQHIRARRAAPKWSLLQNYYKVQKSFPPFHLITFNLLLLQVLTADTISLAEMATPYIWSPLPKGFAQGAIPGEHGRWDGMGGDVQQYAPSSKTGMQCTKQWYEPWHTELQWVVFACLKKPTPLPWAINWCMVSLASLPNRK